jgi:hypothetical protein
VQVEVGTMLGLTVRLLLIGGPIRQRSRSASATGRSSAAMTNAIFGTARNGRMVSSAPGSPQGERTAA